MFPFRSRFEATFALALCLAIGLMTITPVLSAIPFAVLILLCLTGPFVQRLSFFLPIIRRGDRTQAEVSLTFDDGPDPETTPLLLDLLSRYGVQGTFFVIGHKAATFPDLIEKILKSGHDIGNHSHSHDVFLMLKGSLRIGQEILDCQETLARFAIRPKVFRPPVGITNPHLRQILAHLDLACVGFSCRAADFGNRRIHEIAGKVLGKVRSGDILLLHDCLPHGTTTAGQWLAEVEKILVGLREKKLQPVPLSRLINQPVMEKIQEAEE